MNKIAASLFISMVFFLCVSPLAGDEYYYFPLIGMTESPKQSLYMAVKTKELMPWREQKLMLPWGTGPNGTEVYPVWADENGIVNRSRTAPRNTREVLWVAVKVPKDFSPAGQVFVPERNDRNAFTRRFSSRDIPKNCKRDALSFWSARQTYYRTLTELSLPGQSIFAAELRRCDDELNKLNQERADRSGTMQNRPPRDPENELRDTFAFFSGSRAVSENLQLDRPLLSAGTDPDQIELSKLTGITTQEFDWSKLTGPFPASPSDYLASYIPSDQPACLFPDFGIMISLFDEVDTKGFPILSLFRSRTENAHLTEFYRRQLSLPDTELGRWFGRFAIRSVAVTASDPFVLCGTDLAVFFESDQMDLFLAGLQHQMDQSAEAFPSARRTGHQEMGMPYEYIRTTDRTLSTYLIRLSPRVAMVTNSPVQIRKAVSCLKNETRTIAGLSEYHYFRGKYPKSAGESAFILLSDQTIRTWCSPRWRIADSRRARALGWLKQIQADHLIGNNSLNPKTKKALEGNLGSLSFGDSGIRSDRYGTLHFMTPISEMEITRVSEGEAKAYEWYRDQYQRNWRSYFDPIAIQLKKDRNKTTLALTVMPLILASDYHPLRVTAGAQKIRDGQGDPHDRAIGQFVMALDHRSRPVQEVGRFMSGIVSSLSGEALNWLGEWLTLYGDEDSFWNEWMSDQIRENRSGSRFLEENLHRMPLALAIGVRDPLKLALFLSGLRRYIEQSAPGMLVWEERRTKSGDPFVTIRPSKNDGGKNFSSLRIHYATTPDTFLLTLSADVVEQFFARRKVERNTSFPWPGKSASLIVRPKLMDLIFSLARQSSLSEMRSRSWSVLPVLNEYRRRFHNQDVLSLFRQHWGVEPLCPGGQGFQWNEELGGYQSRIFGSPLSPRMPMEFDPLKQWAREVSFGMTFEHEGLEIKAVINETPGLKDQ